MKRGVLYGGPSSLQWRFVMNIKAAIGTLALVIIGLVLPHAAAGQQVPRDVGEGWNGEFEHAARQLTQLAEAIPAEKFGWRPGAGVRSISEVCMHIALG